jgi:hypothetical protein
MTRVRTSYDVLASIVAVTCRVNRPLSRPHDDAPRNTRHSAADNQNDQDAILEAKTKLS